LTKVLLYFGRELKIALPENVMRLPVMKLFAERIKSSFPVSRKRATQTLLISQQQSKNENEPI